MAVYVLMPEEHVEWIAIAAGMAREAYDGLCPRTSAEAELFEKCRNAESFLKGCASGILNYQTKIIGSDKAKVGTVYFETRENDLTRQLYGNCLDGKKLVWMRKPGDLSNETAAKFANAGVTDPVYDFYQRDWEKADVKTLEDNPPAHGTVGVARLGDKHIANIGKALEENEHAVRVLPSLGYRERIDNRLRELGLDVDEIRISKLI